jgi:hypothetical protein
MKRYRVAVLGLVVAGSVLVPASAQADVGVPAAGSTCPAELADTMTLLPDESTYVRCQQSGLGYAWAPVQTPFEPNDTWLSYGPAITLHGQGMRNPNLSSGQWTATPQDPETTCQATQTTVVEAGVLAEPQIVAGEQGQPIDVEMLPKLFYVDLAGNCLWSKQ